MTFDTAAVMGNSSANHEKLVQKLEKLISKYFDHEYFLNDFTVLGMILGTNIDLESQYNLREYLHVLRRLGKVKGYTPCGCEYLEDVGGFFLAGNSNATDFFAYDLVQAMSTQLECVGARKLNLKTVEREAEGILRVEVHLKKPKAIRLYTNGYTIDDQLAELFENRQAIFKAVFASVVPCGAYYQKSGATEIIRREVKDDALKRRMLATAAERQRYGEVEDLYPQQQSFSSGW